MVKEPPCECPTDNSHLVFVIYFINGVKQHTVNHLVGQTAAELVDCGAVKIHARSAHLRPRISFICAEVEYSLP